MPFELFTRLSHAQPTRSVALHKGESSVILGLKFVEEPPEHLSIIVSGPQTISRDDGSQDDGISKDLGYSLATLACPLTCNDLNTSFEVIEGDIHAKAAN